MNGAKYNFLLQKCRSLEQLKRIHAQAITLGLVHLQPLLTKVINSYTKFNKPLDAQNVFNQIRDPDIVSWTCLMSLYLHIKQPIKALTVFSDLISAGLKPDCFSVVGALSSCGRNNDLGNGKAVHGMIFRHVLGSDSVVGNALIDMYSRNGEIEIAKSVFMEMGLFKDVVSWTSLLHGFIKCNDLDSALYLFDEMPQRNSVSWTAMISGYVRHRTPIRALQLFQQMKLDGKSSPTGTTIVSVLSACADIGALDLGQSIHGCINKSNLDMHTNTTVSNALMDMYSKSGMIDMTEKIFSEMPITDVFSWTTMISGFALHGKGSNALEVFYEMLKSRVVPNEVTFVAVLSACSHAGLVDEGQAWFKNMSYIYGFEHQIQHYGCMVDLLGRVGLVEEAKGLIERMSIEPDAVIWRSLLSACLLHGNLKLALMVGNKITELEPDDDGIYILLWNIHCSANRWEEALKTRKRMKNLRIKKKPGCSWIEVNAVVHEFLAEDKNHGIHAEIYPVLEAMAEHLKMDSNLSTSY